MQPMELSNFNPTELDCDEWIETVSRAGAKYAVLVCKHHDGFANWPSAYTRYSVANTPWKNGKGDVVAEYVAACRKYGVKVGLYYSPAQFGSVQISSEDYDEYFISQIRELLTGYGTIDYLWFDGCGSEGHTYDTARIVAEIRRLQPHILLFELWDPDTRWIGNEAGVADSPNRLYVRRQDSDGLCFLPGECDCRMRLENWFYSDNDADTVKSVDELMGLYHYSVGRGANLLINIGPDRRGKLPEADKAALLQFGQTVRQSFSDFIPCRPQASSRSLTLMLETQPVNYVLLREEITNENEIGAFEIKAYPYPYGSPITVYRGTTVGHKAICSFPTIRTNRIEIVFDRDKTVAAQLKYLPRY